MPLDMYRALGRSGLVVSPIALGTMTFGPGVWSATDASARAIFEAYRSQTFMLAGKVRRLWGNLSSRPVPVIRLSLQRSLALTHLPSKMLAVQPKQSNPNAGGAGAKNIYRALHASLKRLGTDYIDLYWMHIWDGVTPVEEIVQTLGDLVRAGLIRYYAFSDMPAWLAMKAATIAVERRVPGPIAMQVEYSLVARDAENEHIPAAREAGMSIVPWSPLAGGFLTGKYLRGGTSGSGRLNKPNPFGNSKFVDRNWQTLDVVKAVATEIDRPAAQVALAWVMAQPGVTSTLVGASDAGQLASNIAAAEIVLTQDQLNRLSEASAPSLGFGAGLVQPSIRRMVFGGRSVTGWGE